MTGCGLRRCIAALSLATVLCQTGCALFEPPPGTKSPQDSSLPSTTSTALSLPPPVAASDAPVAYAVRIEAPDALRDLLLTYLDLERFRAATAADALSAAELDRLIAAAPVQARNLLQTEGYFDAEVRVVREPGDLPTVLVSVVPGPRTTIDRVTIETQGDLQTAIAAGDAEARRLMTALQTHWSLPPGQPFRQSLWVDAKNALLGQLRTSGYAVATWSGTSAQINAETHTAQLLLIADSGPLFRIGELRIEGLQRHDERVVRRLADFVTGAPASEKRLLDFQERLQKAGLFEGTTVELDADPATAAAAPLIVRVRELPLQQVTIGVGISANVGPRVSLEHTHRRPFGLYLTARNKFELARERRAWEGELTTHPLDGLYRDLLSGSVERLEVAEEIRTSWNARLGRAKETATIDRLYFGEVVSSEVVNAAGRQRGDAVSANYHAVWRRVDNVLLPTRGATYGLQLGTGYARSNFADNGLFTRAYGRVTGYLPLGRSWFSQARLELGQLFAGDSVGLPDTLLFRAGGDDSVRGYGYRTLGPVVNGVLGSGRVLMTSSLEVARPISDRLPSLWGAAFIDAGQAAYSWKALDPVLGYGLGLRWRSPVGPLRVDLAYGEAIRKVRLHLSVGIAL